MIVPITRPIVTQPTLDFIVRVDRSVRPTYPEWMKKVMHPDLEGTGPAEYDLQRQIEEWPHDDPKTGVVSGNIIYKALKHDNALADQLGLADLFAIQVKGIAVFRKLFAGKAVFGWKSVVEDRCGHLYVPYLYEGGDGVVLYWSWLGSVWVSYNPALRFRK